MDIAQEVFDRKRVVLGRLAEAGFVLLQEHGHEMRDSDDADISESGRDGSESRYNDSDCGSESCYLYTEQFMDGSLTAVIKISPDGRVANSVIDTDSGDEYLPMNIEAYTGSYVGEAREEYRALLEKVAAKCFSDVLFMSDQANRIASEISAAFNVEPEFPFTVKEKDKEARQDKDTAVFRHKDTGKWFAITMTVKCGKLEGYSSAVNPDERINLMNVKIYPEELDNLLKEPGLYRCYHMNKKQWISIALDDEATDERIMELLKISFGLTSGGSLVRRRGSTRLAGIKTLSGDVPPGGYTLRGASSANGETTVYYEESGGRRYWLIPSNPATFDVAKGFRDSGNDTLDWHHRINVMPGDIVYIYQTEPVASIMWECEVLESYKPRPAGWGSFAPNAKYSMTLKRLRSFKKGEYPRSWLNEHGVIKTVRGQRSAPDELVQAMRSSE